MEIIETEGNGRRRKTKEAWNIKMKKPKRTYTHQSTLEELYKVSAEDRRRRSAARKNQKEEKEQK